MDNTEDQYRKKETGNWFSVIREKFREIAGESSRVEIELNEAEEAEQAQYFRKWACSAEVAGCVLEAGHFFGILRGSL